MKLRFLLTLAVLCLVAAPAAAQGPTFGAQLSWADDAELGVGARAAFGTTDVIERTRAVASFDWFFPDDGPGYDLSYWELNVNWHYMFPVKAGSPVDVYAGGGLNFAHASGEFDGVDMFGRDRDFSDTDLGLNLLGGMDFGKGGSLGGFTELRVELGGGEQVVLAGGMRF